ncbi:latent-transforming growth factor beta-binding protein 1-like [Anarrhichthys ocellatus]|uniref:latent-transforming growth factor beta-binding protein 1-like n=1 Tax=Anarrhichthys ocellatus TaxID=433405 RepID=UPI0012EE7144|nr:latent-transforming growth factor beta-binding protein 1-like [Anarrhichthys ocellatus]
MNAKRIYVNVTASPHEDIILLHKSTLQLPLALHCNPFKANINSLNMCHDLPSLCLLADADECTLFGKEVCKGGFCLNTVGSYECYCKTGQDYDAVKLECRDINECLDESVCAGGQCLNTDGSYMCFCTHPMVLDPNINSCVFIPEVAEQHEAEQIDYLGICWQTVTETMACTQPLGPNRKTTYTECCCLHGEAWGMDCALCPPRNTGTHTHSSHI